MTAARKRKSRVLLTQGLTPAEVIDSHLCGGFTHICQKDGHEFSKESQSAEFCEQNPKIIFNQPMQAMLGPHKMLFESKFHAANEKDAVSDGVGHGLAMLNLTTSFASEIHLVADEMFTNAVYNAPVIDLKTKLNPGQERSTQKASMHQGKFGQIFLAQDSTRVAVGCFDPYGTLDMTLYLQKILATYEVGADFSMNFGAGGAGIGSYIIFNTGCSLYLAVEPGKATFVGCVFPLRMSGRQRATLPKHLHLIQI